ncbi:MAG: FlgO family outer membrane protein [Gammaproteobacteria bacterium]|nr:FlgO family outer membrane protein [Gammaproteobacteria bacterium]MDH5778042.1 FlgO family outer membrane protein [Gammaproteobacteria bacterium]
MAKNELVHPVHPTFVLGDWKVDPAGGRLSRGAEETRLEPRVMALLCYLADRKGLLVSREELEDNVWAGMVVGYDALTSAIIKLRKALNDDSRQPRYIETLPKKGYRLIADVSQQTAETPLDSPKSSRNRRSTDQLSWKLKIAVAVILPIISGVLIYLLNEDDTESYLANNSVPSIVVLPFSNINSGKEHDYIADGITEDLTTDLSRMSKLMVISRRSAFIYKGQKTDVRKIGKQLNVDYVLQGTVMKSNRRIRVNAQLVDADTGFEIWAQRYDHDLDDIFKLQDTLRKTIISSMSIVLSQQEKENIAKRYTHSILAYDSFLRGQSFLVKQTPADNLSARKFFQDAIAHDVKFARAHSGLALTYINEYRFNWSKNPGHTANLARQYSQEAVQLDSSTPQVYWVSGMVNLFIDGNHRRAIEMGHRTMQIEPNSSDGLVLLAAAYVYNNQPEKAILLINKAKRLNPFYSSQYPSIIGLASIFIGDYSQAINSYKESLEINPVRLHPNIYLILSYTLAGKDDEARWQQAQFKTLFPKFNLQEWASRQPYKEKDVLKDIVNKLAELKIQ